MVIAGEAVEQAGGGFGGDVDGEGMAKNEHMVVIDMKCAEQQGGDGGCRICHLKDGELGPPLGGSPVVRLGCRCRGELAAAHRRCAEAWFSVRGNRRCEICGENATNITARGGGKFIQQWLEAGGGMNAGGSSRPCGFCRSQSVCNLLIACLIIVLILPWFLHIHD